MKGNSRKLASTRPAHVHFFLRHPHNGWALTNQCLRALDAGFNGLSSSRLVFLSFGREVETKPKESRGERDLIFMIHLWSKATKERSQGSGSYFPSTKSKIEREPDPALGSYIPLRLLFPFPHSISWNVTEKERKEGRKAKGMYEPLFGHNFWMPLVGCGRRLIILSLVAHTNKC